MQFIWKKAMEKKTKKNMGDGNNNNKNNNNNNNSNYKRSGNRFQGEKAKFGAYLRIKHKRKRKDSKKPVSKKKRGR